MTMKTNRPIAALKRLLLLTGALLLSGGARASTPWVMAYYTGWGQSSYPPSAVDYSALTALIHFSVIPQTNGTLNATTNGLTPANIAAAVAATHAAGKKILFTVGGENSQAAFESAISAKYQATFVANLVSFMKTNGYDGVDIDMEPMSASDQPQFVSFATSLRAAMKTANSSSLLTTTALWAPAAFAAAAGQFDQINIMTYSLSGPYTGWFTWHNAPVYSTGYTFPGGGSPPSIDTLVKQFTAAGVPAAKIGAGYTMDPYIWSGVSAPGQTWTTAPTTSETTYSAIAATYGIVEYNYTNANYHWDSKAQAPYLSITNTTPNKFVSYDNEVSAVSKVNYVNSSGLGGLIIWDLAGGYRASQPAGQRDLLLQAIGTAAFGAAGSPSTTSSGSTGSGSTGSTGTGSTSTGTATTGTTASTSTSAALSNAAPPTAVNGVFADGFTTYPRGACLTDGAAFGAWSVAFAGYGCATVGSNGAAGYLQISPLASTSASQTHSALVLGPSFSQPSTYSVSLNTTAQLRTGSAPNPWEVGWFVWDYQDAAHFYYFQLKPNGWELGKEDPNYTGGQRFLATGSAPAFPIGTAYALKIVQTSSSTVSIYANGSLVTTFTDGQTPYTSGRIGLYSEDSTVRYQNVSVVPTPASTTGSGTTPVAAAPAISSLSPASTAAGAAAFTLTIQGSNFAAGSVARWNGSALTTTYQSAAQLTASIPAADVASAGTASLTVATGSSASNAATFTIAAPAASAPTLTALTPASAAAGGAAFNLAGDGTGVTSSSVVLWNGVAHPGTVQGTTRIVAYVSAGDVAAAATAKVTVAAPGAAASNALTFTVSPVSSVAAVPAPTVSSLSPTTAVSGAAAFNLTVQGTGFTSASVVQWNGAACPGTVQGTTRIVAYVSAGDVAKAGTAQVTVTTPAPGGGTSSALTFTTTAPATAGTGAGGRKHS